jgi:hypothetical protein
LARKQHFDLSRLSLAIQRSRLMLRRYREERREAVRQYVGRHWSEEGTNQPVPVNLISLYTSIVGRSLVPKAPRTTLSTWDRSQKPTLKAAQAWINKELERSHFAEAMQRVVLDALFSVGVSKVCLITPAESAYRAFNQPAGSVMFDRVDLDDFVFDMHARDMSEVSFMGHRYRVPLEVVRDSKLYSKARKDLAPSPDSPYNIDGGDQRINILGRGLYGSDQEEFEAHVDLWEVYLPRHRVVLTLADDQLSGPSYGGNGVFGEPLRQQDWLGPDSGPYHVLSYGTVPGNAMPKAPIQDLIDLHEFANRVYRKLIRQAERQKELTAVQGGATEDGERVMQANDGDILRVDNPQNIATLLQGGPNQANLAMFQQTWDIFNRLAGNLEMMGGLGPQSKTLGQDELLAQNASRAVSDMQERTLNYVESVIRAQLWYFWNDPVHTMRSDYSVPGSPQFSTTRLVTPKKRQQTRFEDLELRVDPYSMQHQTPQQKLGSLNQLVTQIVIPMMPLLQQAGIAFDVNAYLQKAAAYLDMPDLGDILTMSEPPNMSAPGPAQQRMPMPTQTTRNYNRTSSSGASRYGSDIGRLNAMGGMPKPSMNGQTAGSGVR